MGANSSPPATDAVIAAAAAAALKTKKRKTSDAPLPIGLTATTDSGAASPTETTEIHHQDAESLHTQATLERMATALELSHSLVDRALLDPTLPKSTSLTIEDSRVRLAQLASFVDALRAADVDGVATQLQRMFVGDTAVLATLREAAARAVDAAHKANNTVELLTRTRRISSASAPNAGSSANTNDNNTNNTNNSAPTPRHADANGDVDMEPRSSTAADGGEGEEGGEEEAAQALTGLRLSSTASAAVAASAAAAVSAVAAAGGSLPSPRPVSSSGLPPMSALPAPPQHVQVSGVAPPVVVAATAVPTPTNAAAAGVATPRDRSAIPSSIPYNPTASGPHPPHQPPHQLPSLSPTHATLSIFAPQPSPDAASALTAAYAASGPAGLFVTAPPPHAHSGGAHTPHGLVQSPLGTPGSLPSLFARGLLAPISTPYDPLKTADFLGFVTSPMVTGTTPLGTPMLTPHSQSGLGPFVDWKSLATPSMATTPSAAAAAMTSSLGNATGTNINSASASSNASAAGLAHHHHANNNRSDAAAAMAAAMTAAAVAEAATAAAQQQQQPLGPGGQQLTPVTDNLYRSSPRSSGQASPVKRKSITSKQLVEAAVSHGANLALPIAKSLAALERTHPARKANPRRWTKEEDDALRQAVENHKEKNWKAIAAQVPGRNHTQCLQRWTKVLAPGLVKGHWSPHEDELLKRLVAGGNKNWGEVAAKIPGRTSKQCRERWHNHLDPNIVRGAYTPEEDRIILEAQARLGNRWSVIAAMLPGRTEDAVKIRWKSHCRLWKARKYLRKGGGGAGGAEDEGGSELGGVVGAAEEQAGDAEDGDTSDDDESPGVGVNDGGGSGAGAQGEQPPTSQESVAAA